MDYDSPQSRGWKCSDFTLDVWSFSRHGSPGYWFGNGGERSHG